MTVFEFECTDCGCEWGGDPSEAVCPACGSNRWADRRAGRVVAESAREVLIHADKLAEIARPLADMLYTASSEAVEFDLRDFDMRDLKVAVMRYDRARASLERSS